LAPDSPENKLHYSLQVGDKKLVYTFHPLDFTQVNPEINEKMVNLAMNLLAPTATETVLDLFCGLGNFSLALALFAKQVIGVEGDEKMVLRAAQNAKNNNINNTAFFSADLFQSETLKRDRPSWFRSVDKLLIDPPRTGALEIVSMMRSLSPKAIVYVSCNPATFARDAGILVNEQGYQLQQVGVIDMFPHTHHVETIGLFTHGKST
jgi:23S rRNA (uracil1939-C5)-methyltransferase